MLVLPTPGGPTKQSIGPMHSNHNITYSILCVHTSVYMCVFVYLFVCAFVCMHACVYGIYTYTHVSLYVCMYMHANVCVCVCMLACMCTVCAACMYIYNYVYVRMHVITEVVRYNTKSALTPFILFFNCLTARNSSILFFSFSIP